MISIWLGLGLAASLVAWAISETPGAMNLLTPAALLLVVGGCLAVVIIQNGLAALAAALGRAARLMAPDRSTSLEEAMAEIARLARKAQAEGGLLALSGEGEGFADGFLKRALAAAVSSGESAETRRVMEAELVQLRRERLQEAEVFQSMATAAPILGLMGTLLGMVRVVAAVADPMRMGPAMAVALSSDFVALGMSQLVCSPLSGRLVSHLRAELLVREVLLEGVVGIVSGRPLYRIELHLAAYVRRRTRPQAAPAAGLRPQRAAA